MAFLKLTGGKGGMGKLFVERKKIPENHREKNKTNKTGTENQSTKM